jgi:membrane protein DedA with SNARE-associated domain
LCNDRSRGAVDVRLTLPVRLLPFYGLALHLHLHHEFHGPSIDYWGLAAASAASWLGIPGPGEPVLIAAGVIAAKHNLSLGSVLLTAWAGATVGGVAGWLIGIKAGRAVVTAPGPLHGMRLKVVRTGDEVFRRFPVFAIFLTPSWVAGIHRVRPAIYLPTNAAAAAVWAVGIGVGAYYLGPPVIDLVEDLGWVSVIALAVLVAVVAAGLLRRRRRARRSESRPAEGSLGSTSADA